jgi:hypothetical protein
VKTTFLKWLIVVGGACGAVVVIHPRLARSADHLDAPATIAEAPADINDVYAFMDGNSAVFAMTVYPAAPPGATFSDAVQYVMHTQSAPAFGAAAASAEVPILCQFDAAQKAQCWAGPNEYVTGDASAAAGITSASGKLKVFAGLRADPFFFNLLGFRNTVNTVKGAADGGGNTPLAFDDAGCPQVNEGTSTVLVNQLKSSPDGGPPEDFFKNLNALAIVVQVDKSIVTTSGPVVSVWASTNRKP